MKESFAFLSAVHLFLINDDKILLQRRAHTGFMDGKYGVPSGKLDGGETATEACIREIKEEIGITVTPKNLEMVHVMHSQYSDREWIVFFMTASAYEGEITNCEPEKCDDISWFPLDTLPNNTIDYVRQAIESYKKGKFYSEFGWE